MQTSPKAPHYVGATGLPARLILSLGAMGWGVGQDSRILPAASLENIGGEHIGGEHIGVEHIGVEHIGV